jgi:hypothetical protein
MPYFDNAGVRSDRLFARHRARFRAPTLLKSTGV